MFEVISNKVALYINLYDAIVTYKSILITYRALRKKGKILKQHDNLTLMIWEKAKKWRLSDSPVKAAWGRSGKRGCRLSAIRGGAALPIKFWGDGSRFTHGAAGVKFTCGIGPP